MIIVKVIWNAFEVPISISGNIEPYNPPINPIRIFGIAMPKNINLVEKSKILSLIKKVNPYPISKLIKRISKIRHDINPHFK